MDFLMDKEPTIVARGTDNGAWPCFLNSPRVSNHTILLSYNLPHTACGAAISAISIDEHGRLTFVGKLHRLSDD